MVKAFKETFGTFHPSIHLKHTQLILLHHNMNVAALLVTLTSIATSFQAADSILYLQRLISAIAEEQSLASQRFEAKA